MKSFRRACVARLFALWYGNRTFDRPTQGYRRGRIFLARILGVLGVFLTGADVQVALSTSHGRNYVEANVGSYTVPDPLLGKDGRRVTDAQSWIAARRGEILRDFRDLMYGHTPELPITLRAEVVAARKDAVNGLATRMLVTLRFFDDPDAPCINLMLYIPNKATKPAPVFLGLSFYGNASVEDDPSIPLAQGWMRRHSTAVVDNRATESLRGLYAHRWPLALALGRANQSAWASRSCGSNSSSRETRGRNTRNLAGISQ